MRESARTDATLAAHHDLLDRVAVSAADDPVAYRRIQRAEERLARFYREGPGWALLRTRAFARLIREPAPCAAGRGLPGLEEPLDYALFTWVLWYGEHLVLAATAATGGGESQFVMSELAEAILAQTAGTSAVRLDLLDHRHRGSLVRALRCLEALGAIRRLQGELEAWDPAAGGNVLYEFLPAAQRLLVRADWERVFALATGPGYTRTEPLPPGNASPLQRAWRALLLGPALYRCDDPEAFAALLAARAEVRRQLYGALRWELELRRSFALVLRRAGGLEEDGAGAALVADGATVRVERRAVYQPILLLAAEARRRVAAGEWRADADDVVTLPEAEFEGVVWALRQQHRERWGVTLGGDPRLTATVLAEMRLAGLARGPDADGFVHLMPLLARVLGRYAEGEPSRAPRRAGRAADGNPGATALGLF